MTARRLKNRQSTKMVGKTIQFGQVAAALIDAHGNKSKAARIIGCSPARLRKFIIDHPELNEVIRGAEDNLLDMAEENMSWAIERRDMSATMFYLKTKGKHRGYVTGQVHAVDQDNTILNPDRESVRSEIAKKLNLALQANGVDPAVFDTKLRKKDTAEVNTKDDN